MSRKRRDDEVTNTISVGREALDAAVRESEAAVRRLHSSVPPPEVESESGELESPCPDESKSDESEDTEP